MIKKIYLWFEIKKGYTEKVIEFFKENNKPAIVKALEESPIYQRLKCDSEDPILVKMREEIKKYTLNWRERVDHFYSLNELKSCKLLKIGFRSVDIDSGPETGTEYDLKNACKYCGVGAKQIGPILLNKPSLLKKRDAVGTLNNIRIISKRFKDELFKNNIKGVGFREAFSTKKVPLNYFQLIPPFYLPPMSKETKLNKGRQCPRCKRDGHFDGHIEGEPIIFRYNLDENLLNKADIFFTWEYFGNSRLREPFKDSVFNQPGLIAKPKILDIVNKLKINDVDFWPVIVNGSPPIKEWEMNILNDKKRR